MHHTRACLNSPADSPPTSVQVVIRVRPPLPRELQGMRPFENTVMADPSHRTIILSENLQSLQSGGGTNTENGLASISRSAACSRISAYASMVPPACPHKVGKHAAQQTMLEAVGAQHIMRELCPRCAECTYVHASVCAAYTGAVLLGI